MLRWFRRLGHFFILQFSFNSFLLFDVVTGGIIKPTTTLSRYVNAVRRHDVHPQDRHDGHEGERDEAANIYDVKDIDNMKFGPPTPRDRGPGVADQADEAAHRFTTKTTNTNKYERTPPERVTTGNQCDLLKNYCLRAYDTGRICAKTIYNRYTNFQNFCMLDYVNCMEKFEMWQVIHMGQCYTPKPVTDYLHYPYMDDEFLDRDYVEDDLELEN